MRAIDGAELLEVAQAHRDLTAELGRVPNQSELARKLHHSVPWTQRRCDAQGLPLHRCTRQEYADKVAAANRRKREEQKKKPPASSIPEQDPMSVRRRRRTALWLEKGTGPAGQRAGAQYRPGQMIRTRCAACGRPLMISPATWPYWLRRKDGTVIWLCCQCDGRGD